MEWSGRMSDSQAELASGSFWEPGNYRRTTQRIADGHRLCKDLVALVKERADIEKAYAKELHSWADKWSEIVENGPEYGTTEELWKGIITEAEKLGDMHLIIRDKLYDEVIKEVKNWTKDSYHKSMLQIKEKKEMEESFKNAQKPWEKLLHKVNDAKLEYHEAFRTERSTFHQLRNAFSDSDLSLSQVKKIQDRSMKYREIVKKTKEKYEAALRNIHTYNPKYIEDMTDVFDKCQKMEEERLHFFKKTMFSVQKCLDLSRDPAFQEIYEDFYEAIDNADPGSDLRWWSQNHGTLMSMKWPVFEEYQEGWREIVKGRSKTEVASGTVLTNWRAVTEDSLQSSLCSKKSKTSSRDETDNEDKNTPKAQQKSKSSACSIVTGMKRKTNPFDEEESDNETGITFVDCGEPGIRVRAIYDYEAREADELNFKEGDIFEKIDDQDDQGWCKGRKDGRVGLYPANYVEIVDE